MTYAVNTKSEAAPASKRAKGIQPANRILVYYSPGEPKNFITLKDIAEDINPATNQPFVTHVEICTLHLGKFKDGVVHLNDYAPSNKFFAGVKKQIPALTAAGTRVLFMLGGAEGSGANSSWVNLFNDWDTYFPALVDAINDWGVSGIDLDCENSSQWQEGTSNLDNIIKLVTALSAITESFAVVFAPVASAIFDTSTNGGLSGFDYAKLMASLVGRLVPWLNLQFYNGWGSLETAAQYEQAVGKGFPAVKLVAGSVSYSAAVQPAVRKTIRELALRYGSEFGGVFVWNSNSADVTTLHGWSHAMYEDMHEFVWHNVQVPVIMYNGAAAAVAKTWLDANAGYEWNGQWTNDPSAPLVVPGKFSVIGVRKTS